MEAREIDEQNWKSNSIFVFRDFALSIQGHFDNVLYCLANFDNYTQSKTNKIAKERHLLATLACLTSGSFAQICSCSEQGRC